MAHSSFGSLVHGAHDESAGPPISAKQKAAAAERSARRRAGILKTVRILSPQELNALPPVKHLPRALNETEDSETEPEEGTFSRPDPQQVIKLSAQPCGNGGRFQWRGRLRGGGADVFLEGAGCAGISRRM